MTRNRIPWAVAVLFFLLLPAGICAGDENLRVFVTVPPQAYLAERLAGQAVTVHTLIPAGQDPHIYEPTPRQATELARAHLFFTVGLPFERNLVARAASGNQALRVVDATTGIRRIPMAEEGHEQEGHRHGKAAQKHAHHEGEPDPHVWLAPANLRRMAENMTSAMTALRPGLKGTIQANLAALDAELAALDRHLAASLAPHQGRTFYVFHPAFGYFAQAYGLRQKAVETGGKSPTPRQLAALVRQAGAEKVRVIFVQPQFDSKSGESLARAIGGTVLPLDPLARDVLANLASMADSIGQALEATQQ